MYNIYWTSKFGEEWVDNCETLEEASQLVNEYCMAFNSPITSFEVREESLES